ncbi:plasmid pRiA4b ORF-3 family protein [Klebsiella pneumoniae]|uniref:plasmid pRiA4b ORF-3 family protein n=2 Tax=Klebsiella pneumoniae TaxID=573 RepID=UPI003B635044
MKIYVIKIAVHGVSPMVWRRLRIAADTSLAALHFIFQIVQGWGDDHLHQFHIYGKDYGISYEGGIGFVDNPFRVVIDDFAFDAGDRFTYEYNFFEHWLHDIRVEAIYENSTLKAPFCISGHGMPGATAADEFDKTLAFLEAIVNADDETTVGEIGVSLDIENYCTLRLFFDLSTLAGLNRRNLPEAGILLLFQI